jgi:hypothetical protein
MTLAALVSLPSPEIPSQQASQQDGPVVFTQTGERTGTGRIRPLAGSKRASELFLVLAVLPSRSHPRCRELPAPIWRGLSGQRWRYGKPGVHKLSRPTLSARSGVRHTDETSSRRGKVRAGVHAPAVIICAHNGTNARALGWERSTSREISHAPYTRRALHLRLRLDGMCSDRAQPRSTKRISAHPREC